MILLPPRCTRAATLVPYRTLRRADVEEANLFASRARYAVFLPRGRIAEEMMRLAVHRPVPGDLPDQPFQHLPARRATGGQKLSALVGQIEQHRTGFEDRDGLVREVRRLIDEDGQLAIGVEQAELRGERAEERRVGKACVSKCRLR